ncbi:hypothetical protein [Streptomyces sp. NPDC001970]
MRTEHRYELVVLAAVGAVFAALLALAFATMGAPDTHDSLAVVIIWAVFAAPSLIAARRLWRAWWTRAGAALSGMDGPARLLALAVAVLPGTLRDWGRAMTAELAQVPDRASRWRFAAGCARAALFPPRRSQLPVLVAGALTVAAAVTAVSAVGQALPAMRPFAVTFVVLAGVLAVLAVARSPRMRRPASGAAVTVTGLAGVAGCVALSAYLLGKDPADARSLGPVHAVVLAVGLAGCLWLVLAPPRALTASRLARRVGVGAALALGGGFLLVSRLLEGRSTTVPFLPMLAMVAVAFLGSAAVAAAGRSFPAGVQAAVWTVSVGTLLLFSGWLVEAVRWYGIDAGLFLDEATAPIGVNVKDAVFWVLVLVPAWGLPFGVIGAALGARGARPRARRATAPAP